MYTKTFVLPEQYTAYTVSPACIGKNKSGWVVEGEVHEDYYEWVNEFEAIHPEYGRVWGDFEDIVYADTKEGYENFIKNHPPDMWDYWEI